MLHNTTTKKFLRLWPLFFLLYGCFHSQETWVLESIEGAPYSRMSLSSNVFPKTRLEFLPLREKMASFVTFSETKIIPSSGKSVRLFLRIDQQTFETTADLYEGNQRLALNQEITERIIQSLQRGKSLEMEINGYKLLISPENFLQQYSKLLNQEKSWELSSLFRHP
jgi:hypothetical protein